MRLLIIQYENAVDIDEKVRLAKEIDKSIQEDMNDNLDNADVMKVLKQEQSDMIDRMQADGTGAAITALNNASRDYLLNRIDSRISDSRVHQEFHTQSNEEASELGKQIEQLEAFRKKVMESDEGEITSLSAKYDEYCDKVKIGLPTPHNVGQILGID